MRSSLNTYYTSDTATASQAGGVTGWAYQTAVAQGETQARIAIGQSGGPILQTSTDYIADTVNGTTSYFTNSSTQYQDTSGLVPETTSYSYTFYSAAQSNGPTINTETTTLPLVSSGQHGSGSANSSIDVYDTYGRVVWSKDAAGSISYTQYDPATGAVVEQIQDVNTSITGDFTGLPTGWSNTNGANLVTGDVVDSLGRTILEIDPSGDETATYYNDPGARRGPGRPGRLPAQGDPAPCLVTRASCHASKPHWRPLP